MNTKRSEEMRQWFAVAEELGWTAREIAKAAGIATGTRAWWKRQLKQSEPGCVEHEPKLVELVLTDDTGHRSSTGAIDARIELANGLRIEVSADAHSLADFVAHLQRC